MKKIIILEDCPCCGASFDSDEIKLWGGFCGTVNMETISHETHFVKCSVCGLRTQEFFTEEEAATRWNMRSYK